MEKALQQYILGVLRRGFARSYSRRMCLEQAKEVYYIGKARRVRFTCACCGAKVGMNERQVDHVVPVAGPEGFDSWDATIERMYLGALQVLCKACHKEKSSAEAAVRAENRKRHKALTKPAKQKRRSNTSKPKGKRKCEEPS